MVDDLDPESINADKLFNLFCIFGNVRKIKFVSPTRAFLQLSDPSAVDRSIIGLFSRHWCNATPKMTPCELDELTNDGAFTLPDGTPSMRDVFKKIQIL